MSSNGCNEFYLTKSWHCTLNYCFFVAKSADLAVQVAALVKQMTELVVNNHRMRLKLQEVDTQRDEENVRRIAEQQKLNETDRLQGYASWNGD